jgi:DNA-binding IclR family transcriptional regulator
MGLGNESERTLESIKKTTRIIDSLRDLDGAGVTQLANGLEIAPSTIHAHLATLENTGFVIKEGDIYYLSHKFLRLGEYTRTRKPIYEEVREKLPLMVKETGGRAQFVVEERGLGVYIYTSSSDNSMKLYSEIGKSAPLHAAAAGKAILAHLPEEYVDEILEYHGLPQETENTIVEREELLTELDAIRERGVAFNREEHLTGVNAVGAPVFGRDGLIAGAISVSGPARRMEGDRLETELPDQLLGVTNEIELAITYS